MPRILPVVPPAAAPPGASVAVEWVHAAGVAAAAILVVVAAPFAMRMHALTPPVAADTTFATGISNTLVAGSGADTRKQW